MRRSHCGCISSTAATSRIKLFALDGWKCDQSASHSLAPERCHSSGEVHMIKPMFAVCYLNTRKSQARVSYIHYWWSFWWLWQSGTIRRSLLLFVVVDFFFCICSLSRCHSTTRVVVDDTCFFWQIIWVNTGLAGSRARFALARRLVTEVKWENHGNFCRFSSPLRKRERREVTTVSLMKEVQLLHQPIILVFLYYLEQLWGEWKVKALMWEKWEIDSVASFALISKTAAKVLFIDHSGFLPGFAVNFTFHCAWLHYKSTWPKNVFLEYSSVTDVLSCSICNRSK